MYIVRDAQGTIHAICTREKDALAFLESQKIDKTTYKITKE
jgi:hypothetical protein